ncbi:Aminomethyl transferase [Hyphopichia burtonii NRRL Y-1933]|uniref:Aminomethyltransferase n=1 Tax=Hyphopichia burtonii NRRL Y-1933 TaxID=984485 RepID=A0A1E4RCD3_9ASCO|nr:Aminomethyl transferase [Hyphopichia burtonii NRRL Y-1933]ODV64901.1 Aminomethyl transferase [Hyphopichia burtonii NRRL Y-1933]
MLTFKRFSSHATLSKTPLHSSHIKYGGKLVPYAGYEMPVLYKGLSHIESHNWVRNNCGLFDVSHMLQHQIQGKESVDLLQKITPIDLSRLAPYSSSLSVLLNENGGVIDDCIITKHADDKYYMVTNAGCREKDVAFITKELSNFNNVKHETFEGTLLAIQGPKAYQILQQYTKANLKAIFFGQTQFINLLDIDSDIHLSRTGYTGEDGFELSIPSSNDKETQQAREFFERLIEESPDTVQPIGLAARDSLRLEAGMCLYGNELTEEITPVQASLSWLIPQSRRDASTTKFNGSDKILSQLNDKKSVRTRRIGLTSKGPSPRTGNAIYDKDGKEQIGYITSGSPSPSIGGNVAQAYIDKKAKIGSDVKVEIRGKLRDGVVTKLPFVPSNFYKPN